MIIEGKDYWDKVYFEFEQRLGAVAMAELGQYAATETEKRLAVLQMGKVMVMTGAAHLGAGLDIPVSEALQLGKDLVAAFERIVRTRRADRVKRAEGNQ